MFIYDKKLQYPVKIDKPNPRLASVIISQYGGPDGELGASLRYLSQRFSMPFDELKGLLTDIGTEELAHLEMVSTIVYQLTKDLTEEEIQKSGFDTLRKSGGAGCAKAKGRADIGEYKCNPGGGRHGIGRIKAGSQYVK